MRNKRETNGQRKESHKLEAQREFNSKVVHQDREDPGEAASTDVCLGGEGQSQLQVQRWPPHTRAERDVRPAEMGMRQEDVNVSTNVSVLREL